MVLGNMFEIGSSRIYYMQLLDLPNIADLSIHVYIKYSFTGTHISQESADI